MEQKFRGMCIIRHGQYGFSVKTGSVLTPVGIRQVQQSIVSILGTFSFDDAVIVSSDLNHGRETAGVIGQVLENYEVACHLSDQQLDCNFDAQNNTRTLVSRVLSGLPVATTLILAGHANWFREKPCRVIFEELGLEFPGLPIGMPAMVPYGSTLLFELEGGQSQYIDPAKM